MFDSASSWKWFENCPLIRSSSQKPRRRCLISVETLEDRTLPATIAGLLALPEVVPSLIGVTPANLNASSPLPDPMQLEAPPVKEGIAVDHGQPASGMRMTLAVADFNGDGQDDFLFGDEWLNRVAVHISATEYDLIWGQAEGMIDPRAVQVGDLNGDGRLDLVVANAGQNSVLIALGQGKGTFGSLQAFPTGDGPASVTIADVDNNGIPDLVVANERSNTLTLWYGQGSGEDWTLTPGPLLHVGQGPVHTLVRDLNGDGNADILVCNRLSQNIFQLNGLGKGAFDDAQPIIYTVGETVLRAVVGQFNDQPGLDLVVVDDNGLTLFSKPNFTNSSNSGHWIGDGNLTPVAAVVGDFNADGIDDLAVANAQNGSVSFLYGSESGPILGRQVFLAGMPHPTDLVQSLNSPALYVSGEGPEQAIRLDWWTMNTGTGVKPLDRLDFTPSKSGGSEGASEAMTTTDLEVASNAVSVDPSPRTERETNPGPLRAHTVLQPLTAARLAFVAIVEIDLPEGSEGPPEFVLIVRMIQPNSVTTDRNNLGTGLEELKASPDREVPEPQPEAGLFHFMSGDDELLARQMAAARQRLQEDTAPIPDPSPAIVLDHVVHEWMPAVATLLTQIVQFPTYDAYALPAIGGLNINEELAARIELSLPKQPIEDVSTPSLAVDETNHLKPLRQAEGRASATPWLELVVVACWMAGVHFFTGLSAPRRRPLD